MHRPTGILVTGGAGFIGSHLVRHLLRSLPGVPVVNLDLLTYAGDLARLEGDRDHPSLTNVVGDVCDRDLVTELLREPEMNTVLHLAAESHVDRSIAAPARFIRTNVEGTFSLLEACRERWLAPGARREDVRFLQVSTDEVFGSLAPGDPPFHEGSPYDPSSPYSASKAAGDHLVRAYHRTWGLPTLICHPANTYGPHQHGEKFIPTVIRSCLQGQPIPVYGDGTNVRDWLFVEDHCRALEAAMLRGRPGRSYVVGACDERSNLEVVHAICTEMDGIRPEGAPHARLLTFVPDRPGHDLRYALDPSRLRTELGWTASREFRVGLKSTVSWFMMHT